MGKFGLTINILSLAFCTFLIIFLPFPSILPVTAQNVTYASVILIGVVAFAVDVWFIRGRKRFVGPIKEVSGESSSETIPQNEVITEKV